MKILLLIVVFVVCVFLGFEIKNYFLSRLRFYEAMLIFCEHAKNQISFYGTTKDKIFSTFSDRVLKNVLQGEFDACLSESENKIVQEFLSSIGKFDVGKEVENISFYKNMFAEQREKCTLDYKKIGALSVKLSILFGILLCILLA